MEKKKPVVKTVQGVFTKPGSDLQRAIAVLEAEGFHVDRAYEEDCRDAGHPPNEHANRKTGAICLRITPVERVRQ
jgi:hypothetical protein